MASLALERGEVDGGTNGKERTGREPLAQDLEIPLGNIRCWDLRLGKTEPKQGGPGHWVAQDLKRLTAR